MRVRVVCHCAGLPQVYFSVMIGLVQIGQVGPNFAAMVAAKGAAAKVFYIINRKPLLDANSNAGIKLVPAQVRVGGRCSSSPTR